MSEDVSKNVAHAKPLRSSCVYKQSWMIEPSLAEGGTDVKGEVVLAVSQPRERSIIGALTQVEKAMLEKHVGLNPKRILNRSEVAGFVKDLNNAKWRRVKKYVCVVLRPKLRKAHDSNSATGSSTGRCIEATLCAPK